MRKLAIGILGPLCLLALVLMAAVLWFDGERLGDLAAEYVERTSGLVLEIDSVEHGISLSPHVELRGLRLRDPDFPQSSLLRIERAAFTVDLISLVAGPVELHDLVVEAPRAVLPVGDEGLLYWPAIADLLRQLARVDWALYGFRVVDLQVEARHTAVEAEALLNTALIEGTMPRPADLSLSVRDVGGSLQTSVPFPIAGSVDIAALRLFHTDDALPVRLAVDGRIGNEPLTVRARSGNVFEGDHAREELRADVDVADSTLRVDGTVSRAAEPHLDLNFDIDLKGLATMPEARADFVLSDEGDAWNVADLDAAVGPTAVHGRLSLENREPRPLLTGSLTATGARFGNGDGAEALDDGSGASINIVETVFKQLDTLDVMLALEARDTRMFMIPIARASARIQLSEGQLEIAPINAQTLAGTANARLKIAAGASPPELQVATRFREVETRELTAALGISQNVSGNLAGSIELDSQGTSPETILDEVGGRLTVLMSDGQFPTVLAKLADMDVFAAILGLPRDDDSTTPIRCGIVDFSGEDGVFGSQTLILDTDSVKFVGSGTVNVAERTVDLVVQPYGKDFSLLSAEAPVHVTGSLADPDVSAKAGEIVASLLSAIELGQVPNADCEALIDEVSAAAAGGE